jgi:hypothetical protein
MSALNTLCGCGKLKPNIMESNMILAKPYLTWDGCSKRCDAKLMNSKRYTWRIEKLSRKRKKA